MIFCGYFSPTARQIGHISLPPPHCQRCKVMTSIARSHLPKPARYGDVSPAFFALKIAMLSPMLVTYVGYRLAASRLSDSTKGIRRTSIEAATRFFTDWLSYSEIQAACGRSINMYKLWTALERQPYAVDSIGEDACIAWLGEKPLDKPDKVILYFPGGGYINPPTTANMSFVHEMKRHAEGKGASVAVAMLLYKLRPEGHFPTQVRDAKNGLDFILSLGVDPSNIQLVGDSAGGHLLLQFISHILHPLPPLMCDPIPSDIKFGGIFLVSPSVSLRGDVGRDGFERNDGVDALSPKIYRKWGSEYFYEVSEDFLPFGDAVYAPDGWFDGLESVAERVLLSAGEHECPTDAIQILWDKHLQKHPNSKFVVVKDGVHVDFVLDFVVKPFQVGEQTREVFDWVSDGFA